MKIMWEDGNTGVFYFTDRMKTQFTACPESNGRDGADVKLM